MTDCIFCKIIKGEIPADKIYEDEDVLVFLDINPANPGHTLVIPKNHSENIYQIPEKDLNKVINMAKKVAIILKKILNVEGINIIMNNDKAAGQVVFHSHFHVVPRNQNDGYHLLGRSSYKEGEQKVIGDKIRKEIIKS